MTPAWLVGAALLALIALGFAERAVGGRARRAVPIRVHVNGTRGKSAVTRLVWGALVEAGIPAIAKTTGTAPRLLRPDGTERPVVRRSPASIREQLWLMRQAQRAGARALVAECMAVDPALQWTSEHEMIGATIGVITNVRTDHRESMGRTIDEMAASLSNTIPRGGTLVCGERRFLPLFSARAEALGTRVVEVARDDGARGPMASSDPAGSDQTWAGAASGQAGASPRHAAAGASEAVSAENEAIALAVCRELGIADEVARAGFARAPADPGACRQGTLTLPAGPVAWIDATAANDPESFDTLADPAWDAAPGQRPAATAVVFNHRGDRPLRLDAFADGSAALGRADLLVVTGDRPAWTQWRRLCRARRGGRTAAPGAATVGAGRGATAEGAESGLAPATRFVGRRRLAAGLGALMAEGPRRIRRLVFAGNTKGIDVASVVASLAASAGAPSSGTGVTSASEIGR